MVDQRTHYNVDAPRTNPIVYPTETGVTKDSPGGTILLDNIPLDTREFWRQDREANEDDEVTREEQQLIEGTQAGLDHGEGILNRANLGINEFNMRDYEKIQGYTAPHEMSTRSNIEMMTGYDFNSGVHVSQQDIEKENVWKRHPDLSASAVDEFKREEINRATTTNK
jgi:hypothetical protein